MIISSKAQIKALRQSRAKARPGFQWREAVLLVAIGVGVLSILFFTTHSWVATFGIVACFHAVWRFLDARDARWVSSLVSARSAESICGFVRSFPRRSVDPLLLRAVYEGVQQQMGSTVVPIRASDRFGVDLRLEPDDIDEIYWEVADLCGYQTEGGELNPFHGRVETVANLVCFLRHQRRI